MKAALNTNSFSPPSSPYVRNVVIFFFLTSSNFAQTLAYQPKNTTNSPEVFSSLPPPLLSNYMFQTFGAHPHPNISSSKPQARMDTFLIRSAPCAIRPPPPAQSAFPYYSPDSANPFCLHLFFFWLSSPTRTITTDFRPPSRYFS